MNENLMPLIWFAIALPTLLLLQRWIHTHLHGLSLLLTGKPERAMIVYAIVLLPGVLLHELSHWVVATLVGVRTGSFSVLPRKQADGSVQLGYVEYYKGRTLGAFRESLIGGAPLMAGTAAILAIGIHIFTVSDLIAAIESGQIDQLVTALGVIFNTNDFLVWLYLLFAIGNAMMPSRSDRRAWPMFIITSLGVALALYLLGIQEVIFAELSGMATKIFGYLSMALSMSIGVDVIFMILIVAMEGLISRIRGVNVVYGQTEAPSGRQKVSL